MKPANQGCKTNIHDVHITVSQKSIEESTMRKFTREIQYIVLKVSDLQAVGLTDAELDSLKAICGKVDQYRMVETGKPDLECVVIETPVGYLQAIGIVKYQVDAIQFDPTALRIERKRTDASERMKETHEAVACRNWLEGKVSVSRDGVADGSNNTISAKEWASVRAAKQKQRSAA